MNLAASASFRAAGAGGDVDYEDPWSDARPVCGTYSADLWRQGIDHEPCDQPLNHTTPHNFEAV